MSAPVPDTPPHRYTAALAGRIETDWQDRWSREGTFHAANPVGDLAPTDGAPLPADKTYVLDMFPYPSGAGLHVGHPLGYIGTDVWGRYLRMTGHNVLHTIGFDSFGLPAEQYAIRTGTHPAVTTDQNIARYRAQLRRLGFGHDERRSVATTDPAFVRWTQWIFTRLFDAFYDTAQRRARPIAELVAEFAAGERPVPGGRVWADLDRVERAALLDQHRLVYAAEGPVNWCPGLGTVLSNEEVTARRPQRHRQLPGVQAHPAAVDDADHRVRGPADRRPGPAGLAGVDQDHAAQLDRPFERRAGSVRRGRLAGVRRGLHDPTGHAVRGHLRRPRPRAPAGGRDRRRHPGRPGSTPDGPGTPPTPAEAVAVYRRDAAAKSDLDRQENREKTGVFVGTSAINPVERRADPDLRRRLRADGLRDRRDHGRARPGHPRPSSSPGSSDCRWSGPSLRPMIIRRDEAFTGDGEVINSANDEVSLNGLGDRPGEDHHHGVAAAEGSRAARDPVQAARLAVLAAALLGRAVPDRPRRRRVGARAARRACCP